MSVTCFFCDNNFDYVENGIRPIQTSYLCQRCGYIRLTSDCADDIKGENFSQHQKRIISITFRNDYERRNYIPIEKPLELVELWDMVNQYKAFDPLDKMDNALINIEKATKYTGAGTTIDLGFDYPYYHCFEKEELRAILSLLLQEGFINAPEDRNPQKDLSISLKGYQKLKEIKKPGKDSRLCFVAMWLTSEMNDVFERAIKPAIEFIEPGEKTPRFTAVKIDNVDHINDINDEIIAQIRRCRFMVCDLSGYRGGVYFEAGFAYGLGLDVIYTCNKNWTKEEILKDRSGKKEIKVLFDHAGKEVAVKKEGVHFDLAHRNRIEWGYDNLEDFRTKLNNRIRANIF